MTQTEITFAAGIFFGVLITLYSLYFISEWRRINREHAQRLKEMEARHARQRAALQNYRCQWEYYEVGDVSYAEVETAYKQYLRAEAEQP